MSKYLCHDKTIPTIHSAGIFWGFGGIRPGNTFFPLLTLSSTRKKQELIIGPIPEKDLPAVLPVNFLPL